MRAHVVVGVYKGVLNEVFASYSAEAAKEAHERFSRDCEVPLFCHTFGAGSKSEKEKFDNSDTDNDVQHHACYLDPAPILDSLVHALGQVQDRTVRRLVAQEFVAALNRRRLMWNGEAQRVQGQLMGTLP